MLVLFLLIGLFNCNIICVIDDKKCEGCEQITHELQKECGKILVNGEFEAFKMVDPIFMSRGDYFYYVHGNNFDTKVLMTNVTYTLIKIDYYVHVITVINFDVYKISTLKKLRDFNLTEERGTYLYNDDDVCNCNVNYNPKYDDYNTIVKDICSLCRLNIKDKRRIDHYYEAGTQFGETVYGYVGVYTGYPRVSSINATITRYDSNAEVIIYFKHYNQNDYFEHIIIRKYDLNDNEWKCQHKIN